MTLLAASVLAGVAVLATLVDRRPVGLRRRVTPPAPVSTPVPERVGGWVGAHFPALAATTATRIGSSPRPSEVAAALGVRVTVTVATGCALAWGSRGVLLTPVLAGLAWWGSGCLLGVRRQRVLAGMGTAIADAVDLLAVAAGAGLNPFRSLEVAAAASPPVLATHLQRVVDGVRFGRPMALGLAELATRLPVDEVAVLTRAVEASHRRGVPLADSAERAADEIRAGLRHRAEEAARAAPVKMLFPLALLILPSFLLLSAAPLVVPALRQVPL